MPGFSVTVLLLPRDGEEGYSEKDILDLLDAPADAPGWRWYAKSEPPTEIRRADEEVDVEVEETVVLPRGVETYGDAYANKLTNVLADTQLPQRTSSSPPCSELVAPSSRPSPR